LKLSKLNGKLVCDASAFSVYMPFGMVDCDRFTTAELARRWRCTPDKIRRLIETGELRAINTAISALGRPRWIIDRAAVAEFELRRSNGPPQPARRSAPINRIGNFV